MSNTINMHRFWHLELIPPKHATADIEADLEKFAERFARIQESGFCASITDNAMGKLCFQGTEMIDELELGAKPGQVLIHLNTYHEKKELIQIFETAKKHGIYDFLALTGDGNERRHRLEKSELDDEGDGLATSVELIRFIKKNYPEFTVGAAFNPYEPPEFEFEKLARKVEAGATYVITQPILGKNELVDRVLNEYPDLPVVVETWMSKKLFLLSEVIGKTIPEDTVYDPLEELKLARANYPECGNYLAMVGYIKQYPKLEELFGTI